MKNLKYFMRPADEQIITIPAPASFVDDEGKPLMMEVKRMPQSKIEEINAAYRTRTVATDKNHMPLVQNGEVVWMTERDSVKSTYHILAEALVYPNLKDPALMEYYGVLDMTDMPLAVFNRPGELSKVIDSVWKALGLRDNTDEDDKAAAKN